ncbi:TonB-dependent receptor plug domain-containing protein [Aestuariibaculum sediminum]|uniref:TonB-dependent receptor n=1 Tax=Aestuariibaculum sediminum TaxID=2770637 RepID=A0A8J6QFL8_9FLAO|nr:TonB-dependent receptor [Aestuariibaculum sediminum]MBD0831234.1 TonB-dependent receptor [Aestuariibaculum sediminum]
MTYKLVLFFFFISFLMSSQVKVSVNYSDVPLSEVLLDLESKFNVKFAYNANSIGQQSISLIAQESLLEDILIDIESISDISFTKETKRYYTVKKIKDKSLTDTQRLQRVVVKKYIASGISVNNNDTSIQLSPKRIEVLPGLIEPDVLQTIQLLPGIQSPTETASGLFIRGGTPDQNLILWDGIKMYNSGHFFGTISALNPYITEDIKLYKNGTNAKYGNRISGVIDIASDSDLTSKFSGGAGFNMTHGDANVKIPINEKVGIMLAARRSIADIVDTETFKNLSKRVFQETKISEGNKVFEDDNVTTTMDLFYFNDATLKAIINPNENNSIVFSNIITKNKLDYGFLIEEYDEASQDQLDIRNEGSSLAWNRKYNNSFSHDINAYYSNYNLEYQGTNSITNEFNDRLYKQNKVTDAGISFNANYVLDSISKLGFGYQYASNNVKYELSFEDSESPEDNYFEMRDKTNNSHAIYADYKYTIRDKWLVNIGGRTNYFSSVRRFFLEPRVQLEMYMSPAFKIKTSVENLHQSVSQVIEFNTQEFGLENQIWVISDTEETPVLNSLQITSGVVFNKNNWYLDIEGYYKKINGLTSFTLGFDNIDDFFSKGKSKIFGLDVLLKKKINSYNTLFSYSFMDNDFTFNSLNDGDPFSGNSDITHHVIWSHSYDWKNFKMSLGWNFRTGIPYTRANGLIETNEGPEIDFEATNGARLPNYHKLDFSVIYGFNFTKNSTWRGKVGLSFLNIYNQKNVLSRKYEIRQSAEDDSFVLREINKNALGFTPNLLLHVNF